MKLRFFVKPDKSDDKDLKAFFDNFELIQHSKQLIFSTPEYYNIHIKGCGVFALYGPSFKLYIGDLLRLWDETEWMQENKYFYRITGSPLSGSNSSAYWSKKDGLSYKSTCTFFKQFSSAIHLVRTGYPIRDAKVTPADVPAREPSKLSIEDLIEILQGNPKN